MIAIGSTTSGNVQGFKCANFGRIRIQTLISFREVERGLCLAVDVRDGGIPRRRQLDVT